MDPVQRSRIVDGGRLQIMANTLLEKNTAGDAKMDRPKDRKERPRQICPFCKGTGRCFKCDGNGVRYVATGPLKRRYAATCYACDGSANCQLCGGTGELPRS